MYVQEQNKSRESKAVADIHKIDKSRQLYNLVDNRPNIHHVMQGYFDTSGYTDAVALWSNAAQSAFALDSRLDLRVARGDYYDDSLKQNLESKARKAGTVLSGEAYEPLSWVQPKGNSYVIGPGGTSGADLMESDRLCKEKRAGEDKT